MRKSRPKVGTINIRLPCTLREKEPMTSWAKYVHCIITRQIRQAYGQNGLPLTKYLWTSPKCCRSIFFKHGMHSPICHNIAAIDKYRQ
jgi:hypothetical protein